MTKTQKPKKEKKETITVYNKAEMDLKKAELVIKLKNETIEDLEKKLDEAYKDEEEMLAGIKKHAEMIKYHCARVQDETGSLTAEDIDYSISLLLRIMKHKFEYKPQNWEE
jgi:hypothetical protein